jgi:hypothetical protein
LYQGTALSRADLPNNESAALAAVGSPAQELKPFGSLRYNGIAEGDALMRIMPTASLKRSAKNPVFPYQKFRAHQRRVPKVLRTPTVM